MDALRKLRFLETFKGVDALETVLFRERLSKAVKEYSRRGLFNPNTPQPAPQLPVTAPQHNDPATQVDPTRPSGSHTLLDQLTTKPPSGLTDLNRREFTQRTASLAARAATTSMPYTSTPTPVEDPKVIAAKKLVDSYVGKGDTFKGWNLSLDKGKELEGALRIHPDYKVLSSESSLGQGVFLNTKDKAHVSVYHQQNQAPDEEAHSSILFNPKSIDAWKHPDYNSAIKAKASRDWDQFQKGMFKDKSGDEDHPPLRLGSSILKGNRGLSNQRFKVSAKDDDGRPIDPSKMYVTHYGYAHIPIEGSEDLEPIYRSRTGTRAIPLKKDIHDWLDENVQ